MNRRKLKKLLARRYGTAPDPYYFHGDMEYIRAYSDYRKMAGRDAFRIDDITWSDLGMDGVFKRINPSLSTSGEQYLYHMLRAPAVEEGEYRDRESLIALMGEDAGLRLKLQTILARLGCTRRADICEAFHPAAHGRGWLAVYLLLLLFVPASAVAAVLAPKTGLFLLLISLVVNATVHELRVKRTQRDFDTVNDTVAMVFALNRVRRLRDARMDALLAPAYESLRRLRAVIRTGGVSRVGYDPFGDSVTTILLLDLIAYEFLKNKLGTRHEDVFAVHEYLGKIDAAIAVASYRASVESYAAPQIDFGAASAYMDVRGLFHPLMDDPVRNDLVTQKPVLVTGSNASGKSTYLKAAALCAVMAQGVCTCAAQSYRASAFRVYTSMALADDLLAGESYYVVETKSLKRILDAAERPGPVLCAIDEVLRGTNTVERIAASSALLAALAGRGALCVAATHDVELCALLEGDFRMFHFEETVTDREMLFDYKIKDGPARSRNAILLLKLLGFDDSIVESARERADRYLAEGIWR